MSDRATSWSVTINNPTSKDEEEIALARQKGWKVEGQLEQGENGTPHYQLLVKTPQVRFSAVKKAFQRGHIEVARNVAALEQYVNKEETRIGALQQTNDKYPSLQKLWDMMAEWLENHGKWGNLKWLDLHRDDWLPVFEDFIGDMIVKGYVVETLAVNPQVISSIKKFGFHIITRSINRKLDSVDRQTDRQTDSQADPDETLSQVSI